MTTPIQLFVNDLAVAYRTRTHTVRPIDGFNLRVDSGQLVLLQGPSGCGKTTLLSTIAGLLTPERGTITIGGADICGRSRNDLLEHRRTGVGVVFQGFNLLPGLTAVDNVRVPMLIAGSDRVDANARATALLHEVGLADRLQHRPGQLSGGQQQRVAIARALANDPPVLLADEPTAHLDAEQVVAVRGILRRLADSGRIVLVSTHDPRLDSIADRVVELVRPVPNERTNSQTGHAMGLSA